jgi:hypothetical protein
VREGKGRGGARQRDDEAERMAGAREKGVERFDRRARRCVGRECMERGLEDDFESGASEEKIAI